MINPANSASPRVTEDNRIPMSTPQRKLEVPEREGFHRFWFLEGNVPRALQAGYEYVDAASVNLNQLGVGSDSMSSGNQDLGTRVRIVGGTNTAGQAEYLVLMEIREEWWKKDQRVIEERNAAIMSAIFKGEKILDAPSDGQTAKDKDLRYIEARVSPLFQRPTRKSK